MAEYETIEVEIAGGVGRLALNRPDALNAWTRQLGEELGEAIAALSGDDAVRAILITGNGRAFSSGADLREHGPSDGSSPGDMLRDRLRDVYNPIFLAVREAPKPVVAAVNGPAAGVGCSLALICDLVIAAESAYFLLAFINIGLVPDGGASAAVPARAGFARASEMAMLGERISATKAVEWGLANRVVADDELDAEARALAEKLAAGPTRAYAEIKALLNSQVYGRLAEQLDEEAVAQGRLGGSADFIEGVMAFIQKRPASFTGA